MKIVLSWHAVKSRLRSRKAEAKVKNHLLRRTFQWMTGLLLTMLILLGVGILIAPHFGWRFGVVYSGSMEPSIHVGGVVGTQQVDTATIRTGNVITFVSHDKGVLVTHRVVEVMHDEGALLFRTKGDANGTADADLVAASDVVGMVRLSIPYAGYAADFIRKPLGFALVLGVPALIIIFIEARNISIAARDLRRRDRHSRTTQNNRQAVKLERLSK